MKKIYFSFLSLFVILLIIGTFKDLDISNYLYGKFEALSSFTDKFARLPYFISASIAFIILSNKNFFYFRIFSALSALYMFYALFKKMFIDNTVLVLILCVIFSVLFYILIVYIIKKYKLKQYKREAIAMLIINALSLLTVGFTKFVWARPRYETIVQTDVDFTNWYHINFFTFSDDFMSFISGHTADMFNIIVITLLIKNIKIRNITLIVLIAVSYIISIGRITEGAHFLSDITMSSIAVITFYVIVYHFMFKKNKTLFFEKYLY